MRGVNQSPRLVTKEKWAYSLCSNNRFCNDTNGNLQVELVEGMEVYKTSGKPNGHVGMLLLYDFGTGRGLEWAVFQSASCSVTMVDALFKDDTGPNITAFYGPDGTSKWENYTAPRFFQ